MGIIDIMKVLNDPDIEEKIRAVVNAVAPVGMDLPRVVTMIELIAEKLDITQDDIDNRITLKKGMQKDAM